MRKVLLRVIAAISLAFLAHAYWGNDVTLGQDKKAPERAPVTEIDKLVNQLGSADARTRETASKALLKIGEPALPALSAAMNAEDVERKRRAAALFDVIQQTPPKLPEGVILVKLPPGELRMENVVRNGKPVIRITVDKTVIEAQSMFLGNSKGATHCEATKEGMHWVPPSGRKGFVIDGVSIDKPGTAIGAAEFHPLETLKPGSLFITTPSIRFLFGDDAKVRP